jgi:uncharacterized membrane protein
VLGGDWTRMMRPPVDDWRVVTAWRGILLVFLGLLLLLGGGLSSFFWQFQSASNQAYGQALEVCGGLLVVVGSLVIYLNSKQRREVLLSESS